MDKKKIRTSLLIHDLKNPLAVIETGINSLIHQTEKYGPLTEKQKKILERTLRNSKVAKGLVNDILEVRRSAHGIINREKCSFSNFIKPPLVDIFDLTDHDAAEIIRECSNFTELKSALSAKGVLLNIQETLWSQELFLDIRKVWQILRNLLGNALRYRNETVVLDINKENDFLMISVCDDGKGIEEIYHDKVFESYFQLEEDREHCVRGHGLGLAGALILVEDMGGEMYLESDTGKGAKFSVKIPIITP